MKKPLFAALALSMSMLCHAQAETEAPKPMHPIKAYKNTTSITGLTCELQGKTYVLTFKDSNNPAACLMGASEEAWALFRKAASSLAGYEKPLEAFKGYHIAHTAYIKAMLVDASDLPLTYALRVGAAKAKLDDEWARFLIELQLVTSNGGG